MEGSSAEKDSRPPDAARKPPAVCALALLGILAAGCQGEPAPAAPPPTPVATRQTPLPPVDPRGVWFVDVARERGLDYVWPMQERPMRTNDAFGAGCAAFDADNDGWQDVLLVGEPHPVFYRNEKGRFTNVTSQTGLDAESAQWFGCAVGDYDGDGLLDVLLTGLRRLALYQNLGGCRFKAVTKEAGLDPANRNHWGTSAGFMDLDGDAWLDLVIVNFVEFGPESKQYCEPQPGKPTACHPKEYPPQRGEVWRNTGRGGFEFVPHSGMEKTHGIGLVLAFVDIDGDGRMDFYVGNDGTAAALMHNQGGMRFEDIAPTAGVAADDRGIPVAAMGADWADYDRDGDLDLALSNFQKLGAVLFQNQGENYFLNAQVPTGLAPRTRHRLGFGTKWVDFENDGWADLFFMNGHVYHNVSEYEGPTVLFHQPLQLFRNERGKEFVEITRAMEAAVQRPMLGRGSATADFDNDGRVDLLGVDFEGAVVLLENRTQSPHHWLKLDLRSAAPNRFAYGASVTARAGDEVWIGLVSPATSYLSSSDPRLHFGLGAHERLDEVVIRWPSGKEQRLTDVAADQILTVEQSP
jgi:hypothetical protein